MEKLRRIYTDYAEESARVYNNAKPADGLFGWGDDPRKDPCHMAFYEAVEAWLKGLPAASREGEAAFEAVRFLLEEPARHREESCYWFMFAAQGFARELIPALDKAQCAQLRTFFDGNYPRQDRMPVQAEVYKRLKKGAR